MKIFCKKCGNDQDILPDDLIGEFCVCDYCGTLFHWYFKNENQDNKEAQKDGAKDSK